MEKNEVESVPEISSEERNRRQKEAFYQVIGTLVGIGLFVIICAISMLFPN